MHATVSDRDHIARLELQLSAIRELGTDAPLRERFRGVLRRLVGAGLADAGGSTHPAAACRETRSGADPAIASVAADAAARAVAARAPQRLRRGADEILALPLLEDDDRVLGAIWLAGPPLSGDEPAMLRDLADHLARAASAEHRRRAQTEQARELRRSDALKTALLRGVTHELRSPLAAIASAADALQVVEDRRERIEMLQAITRETQRLERVVANLLDLSRVEGGVLVARAEWCVLEDLVGAGLQAAASFLEGVEVTTDIAEDAPLVRADPVLTERILVNLLHNAVRHGAPPVSVAGRIADGALEIAVADSGRGVDPAVLPSVFEPFIHREGVGLGLGLPLCTRLADAQGARLVHRPADRGGACFALVFPLAQAPEVAE